MQAIKGKVLIVEDEVLVAVNYKDCLEGLGYSCQLAHKVQDAFHFIKNNDYLFIVCDHDLPDGNGLQLIQKTSEIKPELKFIYMTAATSTVLRKAEDEKQICCVLTKPVQEKTIVQTINNLKIEPNKNFKRLIGPAERQMLLEIHKDGRKEKNN